MYIKNIFTKRTQVLIAAGIILLILAGCGTAAVMKYSASKPEESGTQDIKDKPRSLSSLDKAKVTTPKPSDATKTSPSSPTPKPDTKTNQSAAASPQPTASQPASGQSQSSVPSSGSSSVGNTNNGVIDAIIYDMYGTPIRTDGLFSGWGKHEAVPRGVPTGYDWQHGAKQSDHNLASHGATSPWGQLMQDNSGTGTYNVRLQTRNPRMYFLKNGTWQNVSVAASKMEGAYWKGNFTSTYQNFTQRSESSNGGGSSVSLAALNNWSDSILHWWWQEWYPRTPITSDVQAGFFVVEMRLIPDTDPTVNIDSAKFIAGASADLYTDPLDYGGAVNGGWGISRLKYVTKDWKKFSYTTRTEAQIRANPPPY